jgi:hypothetical protein
MEAHPPLEVLTILSSELRTAHIAPIYTVMIASRPMDLIILAITLKCWRASKRADAGASKDKKFQITVEGIVSKSMMTSAQIPSQTQVMPVGSNHI